MNIFNQKEYITKDEVYSHYLNMYMNNIPIDQSHFDYIKQMCIESGIRLQYLRREAMSQVFIFDSS